jgi:hypothetical protein
LEPHREHADARRQEIHPARNVVGHHPALLGYGERGFVDLLTELV